MNHLGDITKISGHTAPVVNVVIGGSPCQDLSVAGKRAGLDGERSVLFLDQIRVIGEMREEDERNGRKGVDVRPRFMVWENVPGAFSSRKGEDFREVLEETARVKDKNAVIPGPADGKWRNAGVILGDGWSIAWRVLDAQFWGVPQRRRRIALVADFGGHTAPEILFERAGVSGDSQESGAQGQGTAGDAERGVGTVICIQGNCIDRADTAGCNGKGWRDDDKSFTLNTIDRPAVYAIENHPADSRVKVSNDGVVQTLSSRMGTGGGNVPMCMKAVCIGNGQADQLRETETAGTLNCMHGQQDIRIKNRVRRLTPLECERLQGYPDGWTDIGEWVDSKGKKRISSDSARYKALGNSIALPPWRYVLGKLIRYCEEKTMASLFDGIGGFPLIWNELGGETLWASEIEEFPIAVTKRRFDV